MNLRAFFLLANVGTICAEFAGIAAAASLAGIPAYVAAPAGAILVGGLVVGASFHRVEHVLLAVSAVLASYLIAVLLADPDWSQAVHGLVTPVMPSDKAGIVVVTATNPSRSRIGRLSSEASTSMKRRPRSAARVARWATSAR